MFGCLCGVVCCMLFYLAFLVVFECFWWYSVMFRHVSAVFMVFIGVLFHLMMIDASWWVLEVNTNV